MKINNNFNNVVESYLFRDIAEKVSRYQEKNPDAKLIKLGIGDVTLPLPQVCIDAMKRACDEQSDRATFQGYPPAEGYSFLIDKIAEYYASFGVDVKPDEITITDGAKSSIASILDLFDRDNTVLVPDPVYPAYVDTNVMDGRRIIYAPSSMENSFISLPDDSVRADIIYICSPNNPTGAVYNREQLKLWVDYANRNDSIILFDAAYEAFISDPSLPRSIFAVEGARSCAIEFCSFSKTAGFTGVRCGYVTLPSELTRGGCSLSRMWLRRHSTKYNGTPYINQTGAAAVFTKQGAQQVRANISYYKRNAAVIAGTMDELGIEYTGGINSPYIWLRCPRGMGSWEFFDLLLNELNIVGTPGVGFGSCGEGYFRLSAFSTYENTLEAAKRIRAYFTK